MKYLNWYLSSGVILAGIAGILLGSRLLLPAEWFSDGELHPIAELRLIRMAAAFTVGGSLALAGLTFQAVLRNPLAEPFILGLSGGAGVGAALCIITGLQAVTIYALPFSAFTGAMVVLALVLVVSRGGGRGSENLLLSGVIAGTLSSSLLMYLLSIAQADELAGVTWWMLGDLQAVDEKLLLPGMLLAFAAFGILRFSAGELNALSLGEERAFYLGTTPGRAAFRLIVVASFLTAMTVTLAGIISFCGLIVPHIVRKLRGCDHRKNVGSVFLAGGLFLMICDIGSRIVWSEREIPIGVVTSLIGGPLFLWLLNRRRSYHA